MTTIIPLYHEYRNHERVLFIPSDDSKSFSTILIDMFRQSKSLSPYSFGRFYIVLAKWKGKFRFHNGTVTPGIANNIFVSGRCAVRELLMPFFIDCVSYRRNVFKDARSIYSSTHKRHTLANGYTKNVIELSTFNPNTIIITSTS